MMPNDQVILQMGDVGGALLTFLTTMPDGEEAPRDDDIAEQLTLVRAYLPSACLPTAVLVHIVLTSPDAYQHARLTALRLLGEWGVAQDLRLPEIAAGIAAAEQQGDADRVGRWHAILQAFGVALPFADLVTTVLACQQVAVRLTLMTAIELRSASFLHPQATPYPDVTRAAVSRFVRQMEKRALSASERIQLVDLWRNLRQGYALLRYLDDPSPRVRGHVICTLLVEVPALVSSARLRAFVTDSQHHLEDRRQSYAVLMQRGAAAGLPAPAPDMVLVQG